MKLNKLAQTNCRCLKQRTCWRAIPRVRCVKLLCQKIAPGVVKGYRTTPTPRLDPDTVLARLIDSVHPNAKKHYHSFYSSELGGIVTEPALMVVHLDDHIVHSGHGVYVPVALIDGYVYLLDEHLERLLSAAEMAAIPVPWSAASLMRIVLDTAASSLRMDGLIHIWLSAGRGDFDVSTSTCRLPGFYVMVTSGAAITEKQVIEGWTAKTSQFQTNKMLTAIPHTSNIAGALCQKEAEDNNAHVGVFVDQEGNVVGGSNFPIGVITKDRILVLPQLGHSSSNLLMDRLAELIPKNKEVGDLDVEEIVHRPVHLSEVDEALEVFALSMATGVVPIVSWDEKPVADGTPGIVTLAMRQLIAMDMIPVTEADWHTEVPYGYLTGMRAQLS